MGTSHSPHLVLRLLALTCGLSAVVACSGGAQDGSSETGSSTSDTTSNPSTTDSTGEAGEDTGGSTRPTDLVARTFRLTHEQYRKSVLDLVGVEPDLSAFAPESGNGMFANFSSTSFVRLDLASNYYDVAKTLALELPQPRLAQLTSCDLSASCRDAFIDELGARAFRSSVPAEVATRLAAVFDLATSERDLEAGYRAVLVAVLNSPLFLYRKELGSEAEATSPRVELTADQIAELLSFSLLDAPPPGWLVEEARSGALDGEALPDVLSRLIQEPAFDDQLARFLGEWAEVTHFDGVEKTDVFADFEQAKPLMVEEASTFFSQSGRAGSTLEELLLAPVPSVAPALDAYYYSDPSAPAQAERLGVLGLGAVLASHAKTYLTSPTQRGTFIRKRFFCQEITLPEGFTPPPISETEVLGRAKSTRELYELHFGDVTCAQCHKKTDNIGFALESFDGAGRFRTQDTTQGTSVPIDSMTELTDSDVDRALTGPRDLSQALSESAEVKLCFARQAFRFYFGQMEISSDLPAITNGNAQLLREGRLSDMIQGLLSSPNTFERAREVQD